MAHLRHDHGDETAQQIALAPRPPSQILLEPGQPAIGLVRRIHGLTKDLEELVEKAERALLTYLDLEEQSFSRLPIAGRRERPTESPSSVSNADAIIALESAPRTGGIWQACRDAVIDKLVDTTPRSHVFLPQSAYQSTRIAAALHLAGRHLSESLHGSADINSTWPQLTVTNILEHHGFAPDIGVMRPRPHACVNYWAVRSLLAYEDDIRAIGVRLSRAVSTAVEFAIHEISNAQIHWEQHQDRFDATSYGFALATLWQRPAWLGSVDLPIPASKLLARLFDAQRSDGTWRTARPLYVLGPRERIFSGPEDLCFAVFDQAEYLLGRGTVKPDDLLSEQALGGIARFLKWASETYYDSNVRIRSAGEPALADGWASSAEPDAHGPECWGTAIVLRVAKALLRAVECAASQGVRDALSSSSRPGSDKKETPCWRDRIINRSVRERLEDTKLRSALLAGPPGTGKTSLIKSFAERDAQGRKGACAPFVTIAPDYLTADGVDRLAVRLEHVFLLLPLLKDAVIFFDEIDEFLLEREGIAEESFSRLLTTAMLPRLQKLRDKGTKDGIRFFVATNHVEKFDAAIIREGRFDKVIAVEPPDKEARGRHAADAFRDAILGTEPARTVLFEHDKALLKTILGPSTPEDPDSEWQEVATRLYRYDGARLVLADAVRLLVADATCARRNATYKLYYVSQLLRKVEAKIPSGSHLTRLIKQAHERIALLEDATYFHLIGLLVLSFACRALRSASEQAPTSHLLHDVLDVLRAVDADWSRLPSPKRASDRALLLRSFEALVDTTHTASERLREAPPMAHQRRRKASRCLTTCGKLLGTSLEKFARYFEGRKQIEFFTDEEHRHDETLARRVLTSNRWDSLKGAEAFQPLKRYLSSDEVQRLAKLVSDAAQHQLVLQNLVTDIRSHFGEMRTEDSPSQQPERASSRAPAPGRESTEGDLAAEMACKIIDDLNAVLRRSEGRPRLPTKADRDALQTAITRLALEMPSTSTQGRDERATELRNLQPQFLAAICKHFHGFIEPLAKTTEDHVKSLVDLSLEMKEKSKDDPHASEADFERATQSINDAFAAYQPWRNAFQAVSAFIDILYKPDHLLGNGTIGRPPYAVLLKAPEKLRATCRSRNLDVSNLPTPELLSKLLTRLSHTDTRSREDREAILTTLHQELRIIGADEHPKKLGDVVWRSTELAELFDRAAMTVLNRPWRASDGVASKTVPYGLPQSPPSLLLVGEGFSRQEIDRATKAAVDRLGLREKSTLKQALDDLENGFDSRVTAKIEEALHEAFAEESAKSKYYDEAAAYAWELEGHQIDRAAAHPPHPRAGTPILSRKAIAILRRYQTLWAIRVDAEHDPRSRRIVNSKHEPAHAQ